MRLIASLLTSAFLALLALSATTGPAAAQLVPGLGGGAEPEAEAEAAADPVELLLQVFQDDAARARLVEQLQAAAVADDEGAEPAAEEAPTFGRRIADISRGAADGIADRVTAAASALARAPAALLGLSAADIGVLFEALRTLLLTIAVTIAAFLTLRAAAIPTYRRLGARARERTAVGRVLLFIGAGLLDFAIVLLAWAIGYAVALMFFGVAGEIELRQVLYLNAFLAVELIKAAVRLVLSPSTGALRPVNLGDWGARRLYRVVRMVTSIVGYGLLLVLPIVSENAGLAAARSTTVIVWLLAIAYLAAVVIRYRRPVGDWILAQTNGTLIPPEAPPAPGGEAETPAAAPGAQRNRRLRALRAIAHAWHWLALGWLLWLLFNVLGRRPGVIGDVLAASAKVAVALVVALIASGLLGRLIDRGISLPHGVTQRVPLLEARLNRYVPRVLLVLRLVILAAFVLYALATLDVVSARAWILSDLGLRVTGALASVAVILLITFVVWLALTSWVDYRLNPDYGQPTAREQTLLTLLKNAATIAILVLALMFALSEIGLNIGPLLASAGVVGLAIGFGAQKLVQDIITGIFIQFENAINVGDVVSAAGISGGVEKLTVRSMSLRAFDGTYHLIPFSSVDVVSNLTRDFSFWVVELRIAYRENLPEVKQAIFDAFEELRLDPEVGGFIIGDLEWIGLDGFGPNELIVKARIKTWPIKQWSVGRAYNAIIKRIFDERGIEIPFPQQTVWFGQGKAGNAPPLRILGRDPSDG